MKPAVLAFVLLCLAAMPLQARLNQYKPAVGSDGTNFTVAWQGEDSIEYHVYCSRMTEGGAVLDPDGFLVCTHASMQGDPELDFDGTNYLVGWWDNRNSSDADVYGARVTPDGTVLEPDGFPIAVGTGELYGLDVCFGGSCYLVTWYVWHEGPDEFDVLAARVTPAGVLLDSVPIPVAAGSWSKANPCVAFDGANFLVVWQDRRNGDWDMYAARVSQAGIVLDPDGIAVCTRPSSSDLPAVGFAGNYLLVWGEDGDVLGARVTPGGVLLDSTPFSVCSYADGQWMPAIAFDGTDFLVAWQDEREPGVYTCDIYGGRVTPAGAALEPDGFAIGVAARMQRDASLAYGTNCCLVAWDDQRNLPRTEVYASRVTPAGVVLDTLGIQVVRTGINEGMAEMRNPAPGTAIVRGVLFLAEASSRRPQAASLHDISGRKVMDVKPGPNDVSRLAPGVYFVHSPIAARHSSITKVVTSR